MKYPEIENNFLEKILIVIPARYASTRLPGKPLIKINNKSIIQYVYENVSSFNLFKTIVIATDDYRILEESKSFGAHAELTPSDCATGTDRIAYIVNQPRYKDYEIIINIQGDEPIIDMQSVVNAVKLLLQNKADVATLSIKLKNITDIQNPNIVKVVFDKFQNALYFSRCAIPFTRDGNIEQTDYYKHIGVYIYKRQVLLNFTMLPQTKLELAEKLEQLRLLENGYKISVALTDIDTIGVDVKEDIQKLEQYLNNKSNAEKN